ncbi:ATP-binding protein [Flavobacterium sp. LBUM151]
MKTFEFSPPKNNIGICFTNFRPISTERIFETFSRLNSKDTYEGTGLGLSLCKKIVERHGGSITATGILEKGAIFTMILPLQQKENGI